MSPPEVRVNTYVEEKNNLNIDRMSKFFILFELICGINRSSVFCNKRPIFYVFSFMVSFSVNVAIIYLTYIKFSNETFQYLEILKLLQYFICALLGFALRKTLTDFYSELETFDKKTSSAVVYKGYPFYKDIKTLQTCLTIGFTIFLFIILRAFNIFEQYTVDVVIILLVHVTELHYFGHLLSLFIPRLHVMRRLMKFSFAVSEINTVEKRKHSPDMRKQMDCYHRIIVAFDTLNEAMKWQMLIILVTTFISTLSLSYEITLQFIRNKYEVTNVLVNLTLTLIEMLPMFAPCRIVDAVHGEARCLIELLSSKIYEDKIEKSRRPVAQAMLALMEARDLSLSLLRVFDIDVAFPFKFLGLLVTYLIILLQFEKVINLDRSIT